MRPPSLLMERPSYQYMFQILKELEARHGSTDIQMNSFLHILHSHVLPSPGKSLHIVDSSAERKTLFNIKHPVDSHLEDANLSFLIDSLDFTIFTKILGTVLLERRLIFSSKSLRYVPRYFILELWPMKKKSLEGAGRLLGFHRKM